MSVTITILEAVALPKTVVPSKVIEFFSTFNLILCAELIAFCGIVGNIINIINFKIQGFQDSVNVTLIALAISDTGALVCQCLLNILFSPFWNNVEHPFSSMAELAMVFYYPHNYFIRASGFITAFAAFERCLCVVVPLRVKAIITRNVAIGVNVFIFLLLSMYLFPVYYVSYSGWLLIPNTNRTVISIFYRNNAVTVLFLANIINDLFVPYLTFTVLISATTIIILKLKSKAKWRKTLTGNAVKATQEKGKLSNKQKKTVIMLAVVSTIYVLCLTPQCIMMTIIGIVQDLKVGGSSYEITNLVYCFTSLLETINCSVSIIVYYKMSTRYREHIHTWFTFLQKSNYC